MRIIDWSSDVCSSVLFVAGFIGSPPMNLVEGEVSDGRFRHPTGSIDRVGASGRVVLGQRDRKSVVEGKSVSVRVDLGGRRSIQKKNVQGTSSRHPPQHSMHNPY